MKTLEQIQKELEAAKVRTEELWKQKNDFAARQEAELKPLRDAWFESSQRVDKLTIAVAIITEEPTPF